MKRKINGKIRTVYKGKRGGMYYNDRVQKGRNKGDVRKVYI